MFSRGFSVRSCAQILGVQRKFLERFCLKHEIQRPNLRLLRKRIEAGFKSGPRKKGVRIRRRRGDLRQQIGSRSDSGFREADA